MAVLQKINQFTTKLAELIMFVFAVVLILSCFAQICTRLAGVPLPWSEELSRYLAVWLTFIGAAYALRKKSLATVEILYDKLTGSSKKTLYVVISIIVFIFSILLIKYGFDFSMKFMRQTSPAMHIPKGIVYICAPISGVLMLLYQLEATITELKGKAGEQ